MKLLRFLSSFLILFSLSGCGFNNSQGNIDDKEDTPIKENYSFSFIEGEHVLGTGDQIQLSTKLFLNEQEISNYSTIFTTSDVDVASVNKDGLVTANGEGTTKVKARVVEYECDPIFYDLTIYRKYKNVDILDENIINYYGRVNLIDGKAHILNTASAFEIRFYGTTLRAKFDEGIGQKIRIFIDNQDSGTKLIEKETLLCSTLSKGIHVVKVVRCNYEYRGLISLMSIFGGEYYLKAPEKPSMKLEFYGDSITVGSGINADGSGDTIANEDGTLSYAYQTMLHYNAQANFLAFDGASVIKAPWRYWTYESQYSYYSLISDSTPWDFEKYIPEYLIINLGTNDAGIVNRGEGTLDQLMDSYISFLRSIRSHYQKTIIICCYGMMGVHQDTSFTINNSIIKMNDPNIHYFEFTPVSCTGNEFHPDIKGSIDGANQLIGFIDGLSYKEQFDDDAYTISEESSYHYKEGCSTYSIKLNKSLNSFLAKINIGKANHQISGAITANRSSNCIHVLTNSVSEWFKPNGDTSSTYHNMGDWVKYSDKSDESNYIYFKLFAKPGELISINTILYISFEDYVEPVPGTDYSFSLTGEVSYENFDVYKITVLKENEGFSVLIKTDLINEQINGAVMVLNSIRWVNVKTASGYDKWFRNAWNEGDWWEATNQWDNFTYKTNSNGEVNIKIGIYTEPNAGEYGPLVPGLVIYIAVDA